MSKASRIAYQEWLISKGLNLGKGGSDGNIGDKTKEATLLLFKNLKAKAVTDDEIKAIAKNLGDLSGSARLRAVAEVESGGKGWLSTGHVKILYERHKFWMFNDDNSVPKSEYFNYPTGGNYTIDLDKNGLDDSWDKLLKACEYDPMAAFKSVSMGQFQIMGFHYSTLGFQTPYDMMLSLVDNQQAHFDLLARYINFNHLTKAFLQINGKAQNCIPFAFGYNGSMYANFSYNTKIASNYLKFVAKGF